MLARTVSKRRSQFGRLGPRKVIIIQTINASYLLRMLRILLIVSLESEGSQAEI